MVGAPVIMASACASASVEKAENAPFALELPQGPVVEGGVFFVTVTSREELEELTGNFEGYNFRFYLEHGPDQLPNQKSPGLAKSDHRQPANTIDDSGSYRYKALVGVAYGATPGTAELVVRARDGAGFKELKHSLIVKEGTFPSETLHVPPRTVTPSRRDKKIIARDRVVLKRVYSSSLSAKLWDAPAVLPVQSNITSVFGTSRVYNGKKQNVHLGTDLRARTGTPLHVPLTGKVVVARKLFYTGNTVILDHGYGLFTIYGHMSKLKVKEGQVVKKGVVMGLAGATGRASGPHLHWGVHLNGAKVDPMVLVKSIN